MVKTKVQECSPIHTVVVQVLLTCDITPDTPHTTSVKRACDMVGWMVKNGPMEYVEGVRRWEANLLAHVKTETFKIPKYKRSGSKESEEKKIKTYTCSKCNPAEIHADVDHCELCSG